MTYRNVPPEWRWPFRPRHITRGLFDRSEDFAGFDGVGIFPREFVVGWQTATSDSLGFPTAVIEFSTDGNPVCTGKQGIEERRVAPCACLRYMTDDSLCDAFNCIVSATFWNLPIGYSELDMKESLERISSGSDSEISLLSSLLFRIHTSGESTYLEFDCPFLGFTKLAIPLTCEGSVVGALIVGGLIPSDSVERLRSLPTNDLISLGAHYFNQFGENLTNKLEELRCAQQAWLEDEGRSLSNDQLQDIRERAAASATSFSQLMTNEIQVLRERFFRREVDFAMKNLKKELSDIWNHSGEVDSRNFWEALGRQLNVLTNSFDLAAKAVFGEEIASTSTDGNDALHMLLSVGPDEHALELLSDVWIDNKSIESNYPSGEPLNSRDHAKIWKHVHGFKSSSNPQRALIRYFPSPMLPSSRCATITVYKQSNICDEEARRAWALVDSQIESFYSTALSHLSALLAAKARNDIQASLQVIGHETALLTSGLKWLAEGYLSNPSAQQLTNRKKLVEIGTDIKGFVDQVMHLGRTARMVIEIPDPTFAPIIPYSQLLFKWRDTYRLEAEVRALQILVPHMRSTEGRRNRGVLLHGDRLLLEQCVYNLVNNAVKYCYPGTKVVIDSWIEGHPVGTHHVISVVNFGEQMPEGNRKFALFERQTEGNNASRPDGLGVGLFLARQIARAHGGEIEAPPSRLVSNLNVPLLGHFLEMTPKENVLRDAVRTELERLKSSGIYNQVVARGSKGEVKLPSPSQEVLRHHIHHATWQTEVKVILPQARRS